MTSVSNSSNTTSASVIAALNTKNAASTTSAGASVASTPALSQADFLTLLVTQLKNQDPLSPQDNTAFVAQLAQFSSLQGIQNLNTTMTGLSSSMQSSQALQASALVGSSVEVNTNTTSLAAGGVVQGTMSPANSTADLQLKIYDSSNNLVMQQDFGPQAAGDIPFVWDGTNSSGVNAGAGTYKFVVTANDNGSSQPVTTYLSANVNSVTMGANQVVTLNVNGVGPVPLTDVKSIL